MLRLNAESGNVRIGKNFIKLSILMAYQFHLRMRLAAMKQLLRDTSETISASRRVKMWKEIEDLEDHIEKLEKAKK